MNTRDLDTLDEDGPELTQFESPAARHAPGGPGIRQRPRFSPVAQPGMNEGVWWHTVEDRPGPGGAGRRRRYPKRRTTGMFARLHTEHPQEGSPQ